MLMESKQASFVHVSLCQLSRIRPHLQAGQSNRDIAGLMFTGRGLFTSSVSDNHQTRGKLFVVEIRGDENVRQTKQQSAKLVLQLTLPAEHRLFTVATTCIVDNSSSGQLR